LGMTEIIGAYNNGILSLYFPPEGVKVKKPKAGKKEADPTSESSKQDAEASTSNVRSMLDVDEEPSKEMKEKAGTDTNPTEVMSQLPDAPQEEPTPKKSMSAAEPADEDEWVEIDKESIPKKTTVEDVEDEDNKPKH
jgi:hypothetical protein